MTEPGEATEVPWFSSPPDAVLRWWMRLDGADLEEGWLHFFDPNGDLALVAVSTGPFRETPERGPVWHLDGPDGDGFVTVSPSVHFIGRWHSPNPVRFRVVEKLTPPG